MTYYFKNGTVFRPTSEENVDIRNMLPAGNYIIKADQWGNLFFDTVDQFTLPSKLYGTNPKYTERILTTFISRDNATGVMLTGEKGSGKSLLAKTLSLVAAQQGIPTILINAAHHGEAFNDLIQSIEQPAIVLFDEFEKVYDTKQQEDILTLLDGVFPTKKLFIFTCNDKWRVDHHMRNRPGRIFYMIDFTGLDAEFIEEYCNDNLENKTHIPAICKVANMFGEFNFDMLKALVEEMNRYNESPLDTLKLLNVRPEFDASTPSWSMILTRESKVLRLYHKDVEFIGNPLNQEVQVAYWDVLNANEVVDDDDDDGDSVPSPTQAGKREHCLQVEFGSENLHMITQSEVKLQKNGLTLTLTKKPVSKKANWLDAL